MMNDMGTRVGAALTILFLIVCFVGVKSEPVSWNDMSRVAAIESLVERGTWAIDGSTWVNLTQDKILINDVFYSDKMPLFSVIGAGVYTLLYVLGGSLASNCSSAARFCAYSWLTLAIVSIPASILIWLFFDYASRKAPMWVALVGTTALGVGTMIFPYSLVLNHHVPAAASVFASFYFLTRQVTETTPSWPGARKDVVGIFAAGFLGALAISFDVLSGVIAATLLVIALVRHRPRLYFFVLGALIPLAVTALLDYQIARTILPPYTVTDAYYYPGSAFPASIAGNGTPDDYAAYAFRMFLGGKGLFAYNPLLLFALAGAVSVALNRQHPLRTEGTITVFGFVALCIYLATNTGNYGGTAYGERWFIVSIPILFSFGFSVPPLSSARWSSPAWILFLPLLVISIISSLQGAQAPWRDFLPPLQMTRDVNHFPIFGFRWNLRP